MQLTKHLQEHQATAKHCLETIVTSVRFLAHEGLALRGHDNESGHFQELLRLRAMDDPQFASWLIRHESYTSPRIQNELLSLMSQAVLRQIRQDIVESSEKLQFSLVVDGTRDITGIE